MAYCTEDEVAELLNADTVKALADDEANGAIDGNLVTNLIVKAGRKLFTYIRAHYSDLDPQTLTAGSGGDVPPELASLCAELVSWQLHSRQGIRDQEEYQRIINEAKDIGNGDAQLSSPTTRVPDSTVRGRAKVFSDKTLRRFGESPVGSDDFDLNEPFSSVPSDVNDVP